jgi:hypothetical protein
MFAFFNIGAQELIILFILGVMLVAPLAVIVYFLTSGKSKDE